MTRRSPRRALQQCSVKHQQGQGRHQHRPLREGEELQRRDVAKARVPPADECLDRGHRAVDQIELWLVMELEEVVFDSFAELSDEAETIAVFIEVGVVNDKGDAFLFCSIHRDVCATHQARTVFRVRGCERDPDTRAHVCLDPLKAEWSFQARNDPTCDCLRVSLASAPCKTAANSSPPSRTSRSESPRHGVRRGPTSPSSRSPTGWPKESLISLKRSRSMNKNAIRECGVPTPSLWKYASRTWLR